MPICLENEISARASTVDAVGVGELLTVVILRQFPLRYKPAIASTLSCQDDPPRACSCAVSPPPPSDAGRPSAARPGSTESPDCASTPTTQGGPPRACSCAVSPPPPSDTAPAHVCT